MAAPASFFSAAVASQVAVASLSHFFMNEVLAAPANFLSAAVALQVRPSAQGAVTLSRRVAAMARWVSLFLMRLSVGVGRG